MNEPGDVIKMREQIMEAVRQAVEQQDRLEFERIRVGFSQCQEELVGVREELAHVRQTLMVYQEATKLRIEQHKAMEEKIDRQDLHIQELVAQGAMLQSALMNKAEDEKNE